MQFFAGYRLHVVAAIEISSDHAFHFGDVALRKSAEHGQRINNGVIRQSIVDELAFATVADQPRPEQMLQVLRRVREAQARPLRQDLDCSFALGELLKEFEPMRMRHRFGHARELGEQRLFWSLA